MTHYERIHKSKIEYDIQATYRAELQVLEQLQFTNMRHMREVTFPFSAIVYPFLYPIMKYNGEIVRLENPLRYVIMYPLLTHEDIASFVMVFSKGTTFLTGFADDSLLVSTNFPSKSIIKPKKKLYRFTPNQAISIEQAWKLHQHRLAKLEMQGHAILADYSIEYFEHLSHRNNRALLFGR